MALSLASSARSDLRDHATLGAGSVDCLIRPKKSTEDGQMQLYKA